MSAATLMRGSAATSLLGAHIFWLTRDRSPHLRLLQGSISVPVPDDRHWVVLGSQCEDWCMDNLREGVLAEWKGLELIFHFATVHDAILFKLVWF
jgi:hypothetical protein